MFNQDNHVATSIEQSLNLRGRLQALIGITAAALAVAAPAVAAETSVDIKTGVDYVQRDAGPLKADVYMPKGAGPYPGIVVVHGGAWAMGTREQLAGAALFIAEHVYTHVSIESRQAPQKK
jgi:acetyl esterase/lipase